MIVAVHQPDLLPWSGFWHRYDRADVMVLNPAYQFQKGGRQRRVMMRDRWASIPLVGQPGMVPISTVRVDPGGCEALARTVEGRYRGTRYWGKHGPWLADRIRDAARFGYLADVNLYLILQLAERLGLDPGKVRTTAPGGEDAVETLIGTVLAHGGDTYLGGAASSWYMDPLGEAGSRFCRAGLDLVETRHVPVTGDSIVSVLMDEKNPREIIRAHK